MSSVVRFCTTFGLLIANIHAFSKPMHQSLDSAPKGSLSVLAPTPFSIKDTVINMDTAEAIPILSDTSYNQIDTKLKAAAVRLKQNAATLKEYVTANNFSTDYCFLVDMSIPSGKNRFFVYNIKTDAVECSSLVSHGSGSYKPNCNDKLIFSNIPNSYTTSLGKYKIGNSYYGYYGLSYKLYGLDSTNSRAYERAIVLHSDECVPETEVYPRQIFQSAGCPTITPTFLTIVNKYIQNSKKPILLWIYN